MNEITDKIVMALVMALLSSFGGCLGTGCHLEVKHDAEYGFEQSTKWGFYYTAKQTTDEKASIDLDLPSLEQWIMGPPAPESDGE